MLAITSKGMLWCDNPPCKGYFFQERVVPWRRDDVPSPRSGRTFALVTPQSQPTQNCRGLPANYTHVFPEPVLAQQGARGVRLPANYSILACIYKEIRAVR